MFGEKSMYGQKVVRSDEKSRLKLPNFSQTDINDSLLVISAEDRIIISREEEYSKYIDDLFKKIEKSSSMEEALEIENLIYIISSLIKRSVSPDNQSRVLLSDIIEPNTLYRVVGCKKYLRIVKEKTI